MKWLLLFLIIFVLTLFYSPRALEADIRPQTPSTGLIDAYMRGYSKEYGSSYNDLKKVANCESGMQEKPKPGDHGLANGIMQFHEDTFKGMSKEMGESLSYESAHDQIKVAAWAFSKGYGNQWTTYVALKNGGEYTFYSKTFGKNITVYCK